MWGKGNSGQLGLGNNSNSSIPIVLRSLENIKITNVSCGWYFTY